MYYLSGSTYLLFSFHTMSVYLSHTTASGHAYCQCGICSLMCCHYLWQQLLCGVCLTPKYIDVAAVLYQLSSTACRRLAFRQQQSAVVGRSFRHIYRVFSSASSSFLDSCYKHDYRVSYQITCHASCVEASPRFSWSVLVFL